MSDPVFADITGKHYSIASAVPVPNPPNGGGGDGAPPIPSSAKSVTLDASNNWQGEHDSVTGGSASGSTKYLGTGNGRLFDLTAFTNNAGFRWHNMFVKDTTPRNFYYALGVEFDHPNLIGCLELDVTHVYAANSVCYLCTQATSWNNCWEYTTTPQGKCHWNKSNIAVHPQNWPANTKQTIAIYTKQDSKGFVTYQGISFNGVYTAFGSNCAGFSMLQQNWTVGDLLVNFQIGGRGTSGSIKATAFDMTVKYW